MLFRLVNVTLAFEEKIVFQDVDLVIGKGEKIGIVGDNGAGKTSLLKVLLGKIAVNNGIVERTTTDVGYLEQSEVSSTFVSDRVCEIERLLGRPSVIADHRRYSELLDEYAALLGSDTREELRLIGHFRFDERLFEKECLEELSGGEVTKKKLIHVLAKKSDVLLLDEPTNHLDHDARLALVDELRTRDTYVIVSHDRDFLNACCTTILEIVDRTVNKHVGNYDSYEAHKEQELENLRRLQAENRKVRKRIQQVMADKRSWGVKKMQEKTRHLKPGQVLANMGSNRGSMESGVNEFNKAMRKLRDSADDLVDPIIREPDKMRIDYAMFDKPDEIVFSIHKLRKSFDQFDLAVSHFEISATDKIAINGRNGSGKSTLLKLLCGALLPDGGCIEVGGRVKLGYVAQKSEGLNVENTILYEMTIASHGLDENDLRKCLGKFLFRGRTVFRQIKTLSGGEKMRLGILKTMISGCNVLVLDEPSNHLDVRSKDILRTALAEFPGCVVVVSHDTYFKSGFVRREITLREGHVES